MGRVRVGEIATFLNSPRYLLAFLIYAAISLKGFESRWAHQFSRQQVSSLAWTSPLSWMLESSVLSAIISGLRNRALSPFFG